FAGGACATYRSELHRGQRYYEENQYEAALALWRTLEGHQDSLSADERVRYTYLRGMTDYRLGYRADARYWLSLAQAGERIRPNSLPGDFKQRLDATLTELQADVVASANPEPGFASGQAASITTDPAGAPCKWSSECPQNYICQDRVCVEL